MQLDRPAIVVALLTPYDAAGRIDGGALRAHVDLLVEAGVDGLMPGGTTGESALLSDAEVSALVRATVDAAAGRVPVLAHVGRPGTATTLALAHRAVADGAAAVAAVVPYYYAFADDALRAHYSALIDGAGAPVYAYTIPERTHRELGPELLERLIGDGLAGLKDSTKSAARHEEYADAVRRAGAPFALFTGTAGLVLEAVRLGSAGAVLAVANLHAETAVALARAVRDGDGDAAAERQRELADRNAELSRAGTIPALKRGVAERIGDAYGTAVRAPLDAAVASVR